MNEARKNKIIVVLLAAALGICCARIHGLSEEVTQMKNSMHDQYQRLMNQVESIYSNVDRMLKEETSLLSGVEAEYGELNLEDHTIDVTVKLVPKLISEDMKISISINGRSVDLVRTSSAFTGTIPVDIYNMGEMILLSIASAGETQTQYLSEIQAEYLWEDKIPSLYYCDISGNGTFGEGKYTLSGMLDINCSPVEQTPDVRFETFVLVTELNGKEMHREDISQDVLNFQNYPHGVYFRDDYTMSCEAAEGDELCIYLEATDSLGYLHRRLIHRWKEQNGAMAETVEASEFIYDPNGVQIFP